MKSGIETQTDNWVPIGKVENIPQRGARCVKHGDKTIAIFRTSENEVFALEDKCPHKNGPLSQGIIHDNCVTCPLHNWVISLKTGQAQGADTGQTQSYSVRVEDAEIFLKVD